MYTIFINDSPIFLTDKKQNLDSDYVFDLEKNTLDKMLDEGYKGELDHIFIYHNNLKYLWKKFKKNFKIEKAAGGIIRNDENEVLFIFRLGKWDLPKGKIEKGESKKEAAIREVKEECGIGQVMIENKFQKTYHIFKRKDKNTLKITHWYMMKTNYKGKLTPQIEEDITEVVFKNDIKISEALQNTYENLKLLFQNMK